MTIDNLEEIVKIRDEVDPNVWLHADAAHGFSLGFSKKLKSSIAGIEKFDSITTDPHKVMNIPYTISVLLVRDPAAMKTIASQSDLITKEQYAFGQVTPFIGSKAWSSLKLWFAMKSIGSEGYGRIIDDRHELAVKLQELIDKSDDFISINKVQINSVNFMYGDAALRADIDRLNEVNIRIHRRIIAEGVFHIHHFTIPDSGVLEEGVILHPLRYMNGNPNTTEQHLGALLSYVRSIGREIVNE